MRQDFAIKTVNLKADMPLVHEALQRVARGKEPPEAAQRASEALKLIERKVPARQLRLKEEDVVHTTRFTVVGRILNPALKARAEYFGEVNLKPFQLHSIRCLAGARGSSGSGGRSGAISSIRQSVWA